MIVGHRTGPVATYPARVGDVGHIFEDDLVVDGASPDLAGATVRFKAESGSAVIIDGLAAVVSASGPATVRYVCGADDLAVAGRLRGAWVVTYAGGGVQSFPSYGWIEVLVSEQIG